MKTQGQRNKKSGRSFKVMKKRFLFILLMGLLLLNIISAFHGYKFTHFAENSQAKSQADGLSVLDKTAILFFGISNPRPVNLHTPNDPFEVLQIQSEGEILEAWYIKVDASKGDVILFHGYGGEKSSMLKRAKLIREMGYNTLLVDFSGSGGSTGNTTTIGYKESLDVQAVVKHLQSKGKESIYLLGTSMGAAAVLKATSEQDLSVKGIIIECPFESLLQTSKNRFERMGVPAFPAAHLLVFWGGIENGFWGFSHSPAEFSKSIRTPSMMIYGEKDARVNRSENDRIYENLAGEKHLLVFPEAAHGNYFDKDLEKWKRNVKSFLNRKA